MNFNNFDGLIFDMDGTLWDATQTYADEWNETGKRMGVKDFHITAEQLHGFMGMSIDKIFASILSNHTEINSIDFCKIVNEVEDEMLAVKGGVPYPGMVDGIRQMASRYQLFMVSNCGAGGLKSFMKFNELSECFTDSLTFGETGLQKADNIRLIVKRNNLERPIYIGDTQGDCNEAHAAGIPFAFASYGFGSCSGYDMSFKSFPELTEYFMNVKQD